VLTRLSSTHIILPKEDNFLAGKIVTEEKNNFCYISGSRDTTAIVWELGTPATDGTLTPRNGKKYISTNFIHTVDLVKGTVSRKSW
jgi:hypothetical protein